MSEIYGKVVLGVGGKYSVCVRSADEILEKCHARGSFKHDKIRVLPGDDVKLEKVGEEYCISEILPRKNVLIRPPMANLDIMFITLSAKSPVPDTVYADKLCAISVYNKIKPVIVITKAELDEQKAEELKTIYDSVGFDAFVLSSNENFGIDDFKRYLDVNLQDKTAAFSGASGAGKSTLINKLFPTLLCEVGEISKKIERGKNTTRKIRLFRLENGSFLADTPGFSMLDLEHFEFFSLDDLPYLFPEYEKYLFGCKYKKCTHTKEDGCGIIKAVENGELVRSRHESYVKMFDDLKEKKLWERKGEQEHIKI